MIISIIAEEAFDRIEYLFMIKTLRKIGDALPHLDKEHLQNPIANILNGERLSVFLLRLGTRQRLSTLTTFFFFLTLQNILLLVCAR